MALNFLKNLFPGKKVENDSSSFSYPNGCTVRGTVLTDGSVQGDKYYQNKLIASGRFINGQLNGHGSCFVDGRIMCEGNFVDGHLTGEGKMYSHLGHVIYEGNFARKPDDIGSAYHGQGREYHYKTGVLLYEGEFFYNHWRGRGKEYYPNGQLRYEGEFLDSFWHGQGHYYDQQGNLVYSGIFNGERIAPLFM